MNGNEIAGINLMVAAFTVWVAWRQGWLAWVWAFTVAYMRDGQPEQRTREEYAGRLDFDDGLDIAEAINYLSVVGGCCIRCQRLDAAEPCRGCYCHEDYPEETQPFQAYHDPPTGSRVLVPVQGDFVSVTYEPPVGDTDVPRSRAQAAEKSGSVLTTEHGPGYLPFHPHAGPAAWRLATNRPVRVPCSGQVVQASWWQRCGATSARDWRDSAWQQIMMDTDGPRQLTA